MRWASFVMGSIAGMAAAAYISKKRPEWMAMAGSAAGMMSGMKGSSNKSMKESGFSRNTSSSSPKRTEASAGSSAEAWQQQVRGIIDSDPEVKKEVEEVLADSNSH